MTGDPTPLRGRTMVVTGATSGLGEATAIALAIRGAHVVLATRSRQRTDAMIARLRARAPGASVEHLELDLADLTSVRRAALRLGDRHRRVDAIVANAGIMAPPLRRTSDGFELQFGVNHLGHFAFVGLTLELVCAAEAGRVVVVSSNLHRLGDIDLDDLNWERTRYRRWAAYGRSKLANLLHVRELQRRFTLAGGDAIAVGAHPGWARTGLQTAGASLQGGMTRTLNGALAGLGNALFAQPAAGGALPQLYAATASDVTGGSYWGPSGPAELRGRPAPASRTSTADDGELARRLWDASEELTGVDVAPHAA